MKYAICLDTGARRERAKRASSLYTILIFIAHWIYFVSTKTVT